ncbi:MAG: beta-lactamase family protein [Clostridia bacterium]|nr:beta-lactamase family protein [Clostridia bacterium]
MSIFMDKVKSFIDENDYNVHHFSAIINGEAENIHSIRRSNPCQNSYSMAKAFVVTAIGMLYDKGLLSTDEKVTDILKDYLPADMDERWNLTTVHMALKHKIGLPGGFLDIDCIDANEFGYDYLSYMLSHPLAYTPGEGSKYTDGAYYLLGRIVEEKSGMSLTQFMWRELFFGIGAREIAWSECPMGHAMGATGLYIRSEDAVKLGQIYLEGGTYKGKRYLSENWVNTVLEKEYELHKTGCGLSYGKGGMRGQMLLVVPEKNMSVAWHACMSSEIKKDIIELCYED